MYARVGLSRSLLGTLSGCALDSMVSVGRPPGQGQQPNHGRPPTAMMCHPVEMKGGLAGAERGGIVGPARRLFRNCVHATIPRRFRVNPVLQLHDDQKSGHSEVLAPPRLR